MSGAPPARLLEAWEAARSQPHRSFTIPGHKRADVDLPDALAQVVRDDVPLFGGLDSVKLTAGTLQAAERDAAQLWGADWCRFSTGGSTHGNQTLALSVGKPGDTVLVSRNAHRSTLLAMVLAGLEPVWLPTELDPRFNIPVGLTRTVLQDAIAEHPRAVALFLVEPGYLGALSDLPTRVDLAHEAGLAVVVDQAWGAHLGFHPAYPQHALAAGADAMVVSAHKTLPAYSQACVILARGERLSPSRLDRGFDATHTTSPAGAILASTDGARFVLQRDGHRLLDRLLTTAAAARDRLRDVPGVLVPGPEDFAPGRYDPAKLVVLLAGSGADGVAVERDLIRAGRPVEMADQDTIVPILTLVDDRDDVLELADLLADRIDAHAGPPRPPAAAALTLPEARMSPREAFFADHHTVAVAEAIGQISAEVVAPYPPGVPVLVPGEVVTHELVESLLAAVAHGTRVAYAADPSLRTLQVVVQPPPDRRRQGLPTS